VNALTGLVQRFGVGRLAALVGVSIGVAAALVALVLNVGAEPKALLYSNLDLKEAGSITQALDQAGIKYEAKGDGSTIMVPRDKVATTRLMLSGKGLPTSGSVGYEIFDSAPALGQTDFVQNLNRQRALEGELARTIRSLKGVSSARVHLVLPRRQLFEDEGEKPSASVVIGGARDPSAGEVAAIRNLIAGAVPDLQAGRVTLVSESGRMLAAGDGDGTGADAMAEEQRASAQERIRKSVQSLVEGVVGPGKARVQVTADLELSRVTLQEDTFDPDGQVVRSTQTSEQKADENKAQSNAGVSAAQNIPGATDASGGANNASSSGSTEETTNYEISKKTRTEVTEPGAVKRLSVAVAVDGVSSTDKKGKVTYTPRSAEEMQRIESLVRSAVGYDTRRGDQVTVVNVRFSHAEDGEGTTASSPLLGFDKNDMMRSGELVVMLIVAGLLIFFVVRPLLKGGGGGVQLVPQFAGVLPMGGGGGAALAGAGAPLQLTVDPQTGEPLALTAGGADMEQRIDIAKIEGQVKASSVKRVAEFVEKHPEESVSILRSWLHETS
jgi:flagellar M-ring protein FliF